MKCDFCASTLIATTFKAHSFDYKRASMPVRSDSDWASCHTCAEIVRSGSHSALLERSYITYFDAHPEHRQMNREQRRVLRREIKAWHVAFWRNFIGEEKIPLGVYTVLDNSNQPDPLHEQVLDIMKKSMTPDQAEALQDAWDEADS